MLPSSAQDREGRQDLSMASLPACCLHMAVAAPAAPLCSSALSSSLFLSPPSSSQPLLLSQEGLTSLLQVSAHQGTMAAIPIHHYDSGGYGPPISPSVSVSLIWVLPRWWLYPLILLFYVSAGVLLVFSFLVRSDRSGSGPTVNSYLLTIGISTCLVFYKDFLLLFYKDLWHLNIKKKNWASLI